MQFTEKLSQITKLQMYRDFDLNPSKNKQILTALMDFNFVPPDIWLHTFYKYLMTGDLSKAFTILQQEKLRPYLKRMYPTLEKKMFLHFKKMSLMSTEEERNLYRKTMVNADYVHLQSQLRANVFQPLLPQRPTRYYRSSQAHLMNIRHSRTQMQTRFTRI